MQPLCFSANGSGGPAIIAHRGVSRQHCLCSVTRKTPCIEPWNEVISQPEIFKLNFNQLRIMSRVLSTFSPTIERKILRSAPVLPVGNSNFNATG